MPLKDLTPPHVIYRGHVGIQWVQLIVRCVDIGGIDDHHCLIFLFIISAAMLDIEISHGASNRLMMSIIIISVFMTLIYVPSLPW